MLGRVVGHPLAEPPKRPHPLPDALVVVEDVGLDEVAIDVAEGADAAPGAPDLEGVQLTAEDRDGPWAVVGLGEGELLLEEGLQASP